MTGWFIVELLGHVRLVGVVCEVEAFGGKLGRVDALQPDGSTVTQFFNAASIYRLTPTTEETAKALVQPTNHKALDLDPLEDEWV